MHTSGAGLVNQGLDSPRRFLNKVLLEHTSNCCLCGHLCWLCCDSRVKPLRQRELHVPQRQKHVLCCSHYIRLKRCVSRPVFSTQDLTTQQPDSAEHREFLGRVSSEAAHSHFLVELDNGPFFMPSWARTTPSLTSRPLTVGQ